MEANKDTVTTNISIPVVLLSMVVCLCLASLIIAPTVYIGYKVSQYIDRIEEKNKRVDEMNSHYAILRGRLKGEPDIVTTKILLINDIMGAEYKMPEQKEVLRNMAEEYITRSNRIGRSEILKLNEEFFNKVTEIIK